MQKRTNKQTEAHRKHQNYLVEILKHARAFKDFHAKVRNRCHALAKGCVLHASSAEREEQAKAEKLERERMQLLQSSDEAGYRALIDKKKHKRLAYLLDKTDEAMRNLMVRFLLLLHLV